MRHRFITHSLPTALLLAFPAACTTSERSSPVPAAGTGGALTAAGGTPSYGGSQAPTGGTTSTAGAAPTTGGAPGGGTDAGGSGAFDGGAEERPVVHVQTGALGGFVEAKTARFLGIPYAAPPVGARWFAPPVPAEAWAGVRDATRAGPRCHQMYDRERPEMSEDCLSLNVYAPSAGRGAKAPVMVFLHGGGNAFGSGSENDGRWLSEAGNVVVVTVNYRLNALGFLTHPSLDATLDVPSGNMGVRDQQLALKWVRDNIEAFGGDPGNVTLFGQSAGGADACLHLFARGSEELVHRLVLQSGTCAGKLQATADLPALSRELVKDLCPSSAEVAACLRGLPPDALASWVSAAAKTMSSFSSSEGLSPTALADVVGWWPRVDGALIPAPPLELFRSGSFARIPVVVGSTAREAGLYLAYGADNITRLSLVGFIIALYPPEDWAAVTARFVPDSDDKAQAAMIRMLTLPYRCGARTFARLVSSHGVPTFVYDFALAPAVHAQDLDYVFGWPGGPVLRDFPGGPYVPNASLVSAIQRYWTTFARTGSPNAEGLPSWPRYDRTTEEHLELAETIRTGTALEASDCDFVDTLKASTLE